MVVIGLDEVGRGCWAGPLVAAAIALPENCEIIGLNDSKKLSKTQRERLDTEIRTTALAIGVGWVWPAAIDSGGITQAVKTAMAEAIEAVLGVLRQGSEDIRIIIDGNYNFLPQHPLVETLIGADGLIPEVSAASIIAKVARDKYMAEVAHTEYPAYGFDKHVGYGTALHVAMLQAHGVTPLHRRSYKPVQAMLQSDL